MKKIKNFFKNLFSKKGLNKYRKLNKKRLIKYLLIAGASCIGFIVILFIWYAKDLPTPGEIRDLSPVQSSQILDRNGNVLYDVHGEVRRDVLSSEDMPELAKQAAISAEDKSFYEHHGLSFTGIARSIFNNIFRNRGYLSSGSTITQQYVKNALLSPEQTIDRKIKEWIMSIEIEMIQSKDDIITAYLNEIPYGSNVYGIEAAAEYYYDKHANELDAEQMATLAAMTNAPTYFSPYGQHVDDLMDRRNYVLNNMVELGYISQENYDDFSQREVVVSESKQSIQAPHFVMYVKELLIEEYGEKMVEEGGLKVTTSLDLDKQKMAEEAINNGYEKNLSLGATNASLISLDPKTGQIIAMVGSHDYFDTENDGQVNVTLSERQPGSSFKPIAYATAFKNEYSPSSILWDVKTDFGNYTPENYDLSTHGPVTIRYALANSLNIPAVKILQLAGLNNTINTATDMGITTLTNPEQYGLSLVLGGGEVKPLEMATAYSVFANQGTLAETTPFLKIEDSNGEILYEYNEGKNKKEVLDPQIAYEISHVLADNDARSYTFGSSSYLSFGARPVAAKTGTTDSYKDAWTIGYTPSLVTAVWVGNNDNTAMYKGAAGAVVAAPIFHNYMESALNGTDLEPFESPSGITTFTVDKLSGKIPTDESPETITDIFASWQIPTEEDDIHVKVNICNVCEGDKLADSSCPENQIEEKTYTNLHSELPNNPNWEDPVIARAEEMGINISEPPTEICNLSEVEPTITITSPTQGKSISGKFIVTTNPISDFGIKQVNFFIDDIQVSSTTTSPYSTTYDSSKLSKGSHKITAQVIDNKDLTASNSITVDITKDVTAPAAVKNVSLTPAATSIKTTWTNPSDTDLEIVRIYVSTTQGIIGTKYKDVAATAGTNQVLTIQNLTSNKKYYITIRTIDTSGNENSQLTQYSTNTL